MNPKPYTVTLKCENCLTVYDKKIPFGLDVSEGSLPHGIYLQDENYYRDMDGTATKYARYLKCHECGSHHIRKYDGEKIDKREIKKKYTDSDIVALAIGVILIAFFTFAIVTWTLGYGCWC